MQTKKKEVESLFENGVCIVFITRGTVLLGISSDVDTTRWWATKDLRKPEWKGQLENRKAARDYLRGLAK